ncbi:MAG: tape measure protein [Mesorhizobium sp.]|nr:tape measure protein [Mesorhizobium sp.]MBL8578888.1 tape measure protein [Mesorhizobium sp.]
MATDMQRLVVALEARTKAFENALNKANGIANKRARAIETTFAKANAKIGSTIAGIGKGWVAGIAAGLSAGAVAKFSDAATRINNALKVAGLSGEDLQKTYAALRDSAMKNAVPLEDMVTLYSRASMAANNLGASQEDLRKFSENVALSLRVSGKSAQESSGALLQLSQVLGGSVVQAQEYNSLIDGAYPLLQAVASGLKEAGGDVGKLTQLVKAGKVPTKAFFDAFQAGAVVLEQKVAGSQLTLSSALGNLQTALIDTAYEFNTSTDAGGRFAKGINNVAEALASFDVSGFLAELGEAKSALESFLTDVGNSDFFKWLAEQAVGQEITIGQPINLETVDAQNKLATLQRDIDLLKERIEENKKVELDSTEASARLADLLKQAAAVRATISGLQTGPGYQPGTPGDPNALAQRTGGLAPPVVAKPVSLTGYALPGDSDGGKKERLNEYERENEQIRERTAALQAETAALAGLNPLINDYGYAVEKARAVSELENAALAAKVELTPQVKASIDGLATSYANAVVEAEMLAESQESVREAAEGLRDLGKDVLGGIVSDLRQGKSAADILASALDRVADRLASMALDSLFSGLGGGGAPIGGLHKLNFRRAA